MPLSCETLAERRKQRMDALPDQVADLIERVAALEADAEDAEDTVSRAGSVIRSLETVIRDLREAYEPCPKDTFRRQQTLEYAAVCLRNAERTVRDMLAAVNCSVEYEPEEAEEVLTHANE